MSYEISRKELFLILVFLESYWVSLFFLKIPFIPLILAIVIISILLSLLFEKYFKSSNEKPKCKRLSKKKEFGLVNFLFGTRLLIAILSLIYFWDFSWILGSLTLLSWVDSEISKIWCYNAYLRIFEEILNCGVVQFLVLV